VIKLLCPQTSSVYYIVIDGITFGPLDSNAQLTLYDSSVDIRDGMSEKRGQFGENNVKHVKYTGELWYQPLLLNCTRSHSEPNLEHLSFTGYNYASQKVSVASPFGLFEPGVCRHVYKMYDKSRRASKHQFRCYKYESGTCAWHVWNLHVWDDEPTKPVGWSHNIIYDMTFSKRKVSWKKKSVGYYFSNWDSKVDWIEGSNYYAITGLKIPAGLSPTEQLIEGSSNWYRTDIDALNPGRIVSKLKTICSEAFRGKRFPLQEVHYGLLAQDAIEKLDANKVNMLEFLADLRHPKEFITRLLDFKNLPKDKLLADKYLSLHYGVLPAIDDINRIMKAFIAVQPYIDKNGYSTYSARRSQNAVSNGTTCLLEQRIKVAIDDNDEYLRSLAHRIHSWGFAPTFGNLWDLIPYSFVVDWLVDVGEFLDVSETRLMLMRLNIRYATCSSRKVVELDIRDYVEALTGSLAMVRYHRWVTDHCPAPPLSLNFSSELSNHFIEGGMLIIQHRK